jgi:hypothetical protein
MAGSQKSFRWKSDTLTKNLKSLDKNVDHAITAAVEFQATRGEAYMRKNAKWRDVTSNARTGLFTQPYHEGQTHRIVFAHTVNYGIWLEVRFSGRYAIIMPSVVQSGQQLMKLLSNLFSQMPKG